MSGGRETFSHSNNRRCKTPPSLLAVDAKTEFSLTWLVEIPRIISEMLPVSRRKEQQGSAASWRENRDGGCRAKGATARHRARAPRGHPQAREVRSSTEWTLGAEPRARPAPSGRPTPRVRRALGDVLNYVSHHLPGPSLPATTAEAVTGSGPATHRLAWSLWRR